MIVRRLAVAAVAALAALPISGAVAAPGTTDLRDALANPVESSFVEQTFPSPSHLNGYFDAGLFASWAGSDAGSRDYVRNLLISNGLFTGYQRYWYTAGSDDQLYETVFVFKDSDGADSMLTTERSDRSNATTFKAWVPLQLNDSAFALNETINNYFWTTAGFSKGNDVFMMFRGSGSAFQTTAAAAQARVMYTVAPNGTALGSPPAAAHQSAFVLLRTPLIVTFVAGAVMIAVALVIAVVASVRPPMAVQPRR